MPELVTAAVAAGHLRDQRQHALHADGWHDMHAHGLLAEDVPTSS